MRFEWDPKKAAANMRKHGVSFEEAQTVFKDRLAIAFYDPDHSEQEDRSITFGHSDRSRLIVVCTTERDNVLRIISARKATKTEFKIYES